MKGEQITRVFVKMGDGAARPESSCLGRVHFTFDRVSQPPRFVPKTVKGRSKEMSKTNKLIPAAGYLRKSRKGENKDGSEVQEKSIPQQKKEITKLAEREGFRIVRWYADPGVSGWKRGAKRPDFHKMLTDADEHGDFQAVLCDNVDRFSRAEVDAVQEDARQLRMAGVRWIVSAAQGRYDLGCSGNDIGEILRFAVAVWSAHEFSRQLGRRIALARRNRAADGKRSGGIAPYGYANDGNGGLILGPANEVDAVRWMFDQFARQHRSMNWIASQLNEKGITTKNGKRWYVQRVKELLLRRVYAGDFTYNEKKSGEFFIIDKDHQVVPVPQGKRQPWKVTDEGVFYRQNTHEPIVDRDLFDAAQKRMQSFKLRGNRKPREGGFALTGILVCSHCGKPLYGCTPRPGQPREYRCPSNAKTGAGSCGYFAIREETVLDVVVQMMAKEFEKLKVDGPKPPTEDGTANVDHVKRDIEHTERKIDNATNLLIEDGHDERIKQSINQKLAGLYTELDDLRTELAELLANGDSDRDREILLGWWDDFRKDAVSIPIEGAAALARAKAIARKTIAKSDLRTSPLRKTKDGWTLKITQRAFNEALVSVGCEVRVTWERTVKKCRNGSTVPRNVVRELALKLGENMPSFCNAPVEAECNCSYVVGRCGIRMGKDWPPRLT